MSHTCCWHGKVEGILPWLLPLDGNGPPVRYIAIEKALDLRVEQTCCECEEMRTRKWTPVPGDGRGHPGQVVLVEEPPP